MLESFTCVPLTHTMAGRHKCCSWQHEWRWLEMAYVWYSQRKWLVG